MTRLRLDSYNNNTMQKKLILKLGGKCNLSCAHCHCLKVNYEYNSDIINYINQNIYDEITFSGGEPLMYISLIKDLVKKINHCGRYKIVTNGSNIEDEDIIFFNNNNFTVYFSYDGEDGNREKPQLCFAKHELLKRKGLAVCVYKNNSDMKKLDEDVEIFARKNYINKYYFPNFIHQTDLSSNLNMVDKDTLVRYISFICEQMEEEIKNYKILGANIESLPVLNWCVNNMFIEKKERGVACCRENKISLAINGDFLLCPYGDKVVGNIYSGIDWMLVESYIPDRCKKCNLWNLCMNTCIENITENECVIFKILYRHLKKLKDKYHVGSCLISAQN